MSHITKEYFEGHFAFPLFEETAQFLGVDLSCWEFADGVEGETLSESSERVEYLTVVYTSTNLEEFSIASSFVCIDNGEWEMQTFSTNQSDL
jgi:hypothetical protein